eukprot:4183429-Amphidinium_carterae.1
MALFAKTEHTTIDGEDATADFGEGFHIILDGRFKNNNPRTVIPTHRNPMTCDAFEPGCWLNVSVPHRKKVRGLALASPLASPRSEKQELCAAADQNL